MNTGLLAGLPASTRAPGSIARLQPPVVDFIGDSITALGISASPSVKLRTGPVSYTGQAWYAWASMQARGGFIIGRVDGRSGATSSDLVSRYMADLLGDPSSIKAGYCCILIGTNDTMTVHQTKENIRRLVELLIAEGIEPILCTITPRSSYQGEKRSAWIRLYAQQNGLKCVDFAVDSRLTHNNTGAWLSGYSDDGVHPNHVGAKAMGEVLYEHFRDWGMLRNKPPLVMRNGDGDSLISAVNALLATDTNADGVPDNWTLTGAGATSSLAAMSPPNGLGNEMTVTRASASTTIRSNGRATLPSSLCAFAVRVQTTVAGTSPSVTIRPFEQGTATNMVDFTTSQDIPAGYILAGLIDGVPGTGSPSANFLAYSSALITAGDGTVVKLSQPTIYDLGAAAGQSVWPI